MGKRWRLLISALSTVALASFAQASNVEIDRGWNLLGSSCEVPKAEFDKPDIHTVWMWEGNYWKAYSPDENIQKILNAYGIPEFEEVPKFKGFWIYATSKTSINLCPGLNTPPQPNGSETAAVKNGLVAYYSFNHCDARDDSGNGYHGVITSHPGCVQGVIGKALKFDGYNDRIKIPSQILDGKEIFTINYWIKTKDSQWTVISGANGNQDNEFLEYAEGSIISHVYGTSYETSVSVNDGNWHMITLEVSPDIGIGYFVDGNETWANEDVNIEPFRIEALWIGADQDSVDGGWQTEDQLKGTLDELMFFDRILSKEEIEKLYKQGLGGE